MALIFYKNSSLTAGNQALTEDFWEEIFNRPSVKYGVTIFTILTFLSLIPFYLFSISLIRSKHFQTVVSYGEQMMNLCAILTMFCIEGICLLRLLFGPLSESWCWWLLFFNQSVPILALLVFDAYYLARYYYVVVFKTATICNEDFIGFYIFTLTSLLGTILALVHNMSPGKWGLNYYICIGDNPDLYPIQGGKFPVTVFVALITIMTYAVTSYKLYKAKKKTDRILGLAKPLILPIMKMSHLKSEQLKNKDVFIAGVFPYATKFFYSTVDLITTYMMVIIIVMDTILWNGYMKKLSVMEMKSTSSGHFYYIYHQHLYPQLFLWSIATNSLLRNQELRKYIVQAMLPSGLVKKTRKV